MALDWTDDAAYEGLSELDGSALAWEFLRRNPAYQAAVAQRAPVEPFGLVAPIDPHLDGRSAQPIWTWSAAPAYAVRLTPTPSSEAMPERVSELASAEQASGGERHLRLPGGVQAHMDTGVGASQPLAAVLPLDASLALRVPAAEALWQALRGRPRSPDGLSAPRRVRLTRALRAYDGRLEGASYRQVAVRVLGEVFSDSLTWRTSSARATAIRLCASARELVLGGYRRLLGQRLRGGGTKVEG